MSEKENNLTKLKKVMKRSWIRFYLFVCFTNTQQISSQLGGTMERGPRENQTKEAETGSFFLRRRDKHYEI